MSIQIRIARLLLVAATAAAIAEPASGQGTPAPNERVAPADTTRTDTTAAGGSTTRGAGGSWAIKAPPQHWVSRTAKVTSFAASADSTAVRNVRLVHSTLQEQSTRQRLDASQLKLCAAGDTVCAAPIDIARKSVRRLELRAGPGFPRAGTYTGSVYFAADSSTGMQQADLTVLATSRTAKAGGALAILLGIACAWLFSVFLRNAAIRAQVKMQAGQILEEVTRIRNLLPEVEAVRGSELHAMRRRLDAVQAQFEMGRLESETYVPGRIPPAFAAAPGPEKFQALVVATEKVLAGLDTLVAAMSHIVRMWPRLHPLPDPAHEALNDLDHAAATVADAETAQAVAKAAIAHAQSEAKTDLHAGGPVRPEFPTIREGRVQMQSVSSWGWALWALLTWTAGVFTLIAGNFAFGLEVDYFKCFFWGLGIQVAGQQLSSNVVTTAYALPQIVPSAPR